MSGYYNLADFLEGINIHEISGDTLYKDGQIGKLIKIHEDELPDIEEASIVIVGCGDQRGAALLHPSGAANAVRSEFYSLFYWHHDIRLADIGNVRIGKSVADTHAALKMVVHELINMNKLVVVIGGSHDLTMAQYHAFADDKRSIDVATVDAVIDINIDSPFRSDNFMMELMTVEPNFMNHYNHIGFQSYFVHPRMLEAMDKLRFDCYRVGKVREYIEEMEPVVRNCSLMSFDISAIAHAFAPANAMTPNGLTGEEACALMQFAGMSTKMQTVGIYSYRPEKDVENLTAKQISQMLWYLMDGRSRGNREALIDERDSFNEFHLSFAEVQTTFIQSKKTGRWWMQLPDRQFIACSYKDYLQASCNEIPERWLRAQERP
jgi:arginase family enzyme